MRRESEKNNLDTFFAMIDLIEDDISEMLENENSKLNGYECLVISFNRLTLFCQQVGIDFSQTEDHYNEFKKNPPDGILQSYNEASDVERSEVEEFNIALEEIENTLAVFETRCKKTGEMFDEWNCVFIMHACLRKHCDKLEVNYIEVIEDVLKVQSDLEKEEKTEPEDTNTLN